MEEGKEDQESNAEEKLESNGTEAEDSPKEISLEDKVKELEDKILRSAAEVENIRKRSEKERAEAYKIGISLFVKDFVHERSRDDAVVLARRSAHLRKRNHHLLERRQSVLQQPPILRVDVFIHLLHHKAKREHVQSLKHWANVEHVLGSFRPFVFLGA